MSNFLCKPYTTTLIGAMLLFGCRGKSETARQRESSHLRSLISAYNFAASKLGHSPANEAEFKSFIATNARPMLDSLHIQNVDDLFVSERDGQAFVVLYGERTAASAPDVIAYEQTGIATNRLVGHSLGMIEEADEQRFAELVPTAGTK